MDERVTIKAQHRNYFLIIFGIFIIILSIFLVYLVISGMTVTTTTQQVATAPTSSPGAPIPTQVSDVTQQTKVATSLTIPTRYPGLSWSDVTATASVGGLLTVSGELLGNKGNSVPIPFPVAKVYESSKGTTSSLDATLIDSYYSVQLGQLGWIVQGNDPYLTFHTFRLRGIVADNPCGGTSGYLGYKDGSVMVVSVSHSVSPCSPHAVQASPSARLTETYDVFISNPMTVQSLAEFIKNHIK